MITLIEAKNYRCLRYIRQPVDSFHVLVGCNGSGKTTFFDVITFLGDLVSKGPLAAVHARTEDCRDMFWCRSGRGFELAVEASIPEKLRSLLQDADNNSVRYEIALDFDEESRDIFIRAEKVLLKVPDSEPINLQHSLFSNSMVPPDTIITPKRARGTTVLVNKVQNGNDNFYSEVYREKGRGWAPSYKFGPYKSALGNLPADEANFPVTSWLKRLLTDNVAQLIPGSRPIRRASAPGQGCNFKTDGSNLPWVINHLITTDPDLFGQWLSHLRTAIPDLKNIRTVERPDDRHRYLLLEFSDGLSVPSWLASDGTLRLLAFTILAYLPGFSGIYMIKGPENGIHPTAVETLIRSLSSIKKAQIFLTTYTPIVPGLIETEKILGFSRTKEGAIHIIKGVHSLG